jgi:hypothetical protein
MKTLSDENLVELEECTKHASDVIRHARCLQTMFQHRGIFFSEKMTEIDSCLLKNY